MKHARQFLRWLHVEDDDRRLSLTTIAFLFALVCIWQGKSLSLPELAAFVTAIAAHRQRQAANAAKIISALVGHTIEQDPQIQPQEQP